MWWKRLLIHLSDTELVKVKSSIALHLPFISGTNFTKSLGLKVLMPLLCKFSSP